MEQKKSIRILLIVIFVSIIALAYVMSKLIAINSECQANPFVYGAKQLKEQEQSLICSCTFKDSRINGFSFNESGIFMDKNRLNKVWYDLPYYNISNST